MSTDLLSLKTKPAQKAVPPTRKREAKAVVTAEKCSKCKRDNPNWITNDVTFAMVGRKDKLCPTCYIHSALKKGIDLTWRVELK